MAIAATEQQEAAKIRNIETISYWLAKSVFVDPQGRGDFVDYARISEPPKPGVAFSGGVLRYEKYPHTLEMLQEFTSESRLCIGKSRQIGFSWGVGIYVCWQLMFFPGSNWLEISKSQSDAQELLAKTKTVFKLLPDSWKDGSITGVPLKILKDNGSEFVLSNGSRAHSLAAGEDAGRSFTASGVVLDEVDFQQYVDQIFMAVKPTIDAGGQMILGTTRNKRRGVSLFLNLFKNAPANGWKRLFYGWRVMPKRDDKWFERTRLEALDIPDAREMGVDLYMEQEYPQTIEEFLAPSRAISHFNYDSLMAMKGRVETPIEVRDNGRTKIWRRRKPGMRYMAGTDASKGIGSDYSVTAVMSGDGEVVAMRRANNEEPESFAFESLKLLEEYGKPYWGIEDNDQGVRMINVARDERYSNLYSHKTSKGRKVHGWHTDGSSRPRLWGDMSTAVYEGQLTVFGETELQEFFNVVKDEDGRPAAAAGSNDDIPTAIGIGWQMRHKAWAPSESNKLEMAPMF